MFNLNFVAEPGIHVESIEASWSFLPKSTESETTVSKKSSIVESKKPGAHWKFYGITIFAIIILPVIGMFINSQPKVSQEMVLNQVMDLIIESGYMKDLKLTEAHFKPDFVKVTITANELGFLQNFIQKYRKEDNIPYEIFQKNKMNYVSLNFPWEGNKTGGDIEDLKTLTDKTIFSKKISISFTDNEFGLQGQYSDIISYLLQMAENDLIRKFTLSILRLESDTFYLKIWANKT